MTTQAKATEGAIMVAVRELVGGMTRERHEQVLHRFRVWRTLIDNKDIVRDLEIHATNLGNPAWLAQVKQVAVEFCDWARLIHRYNAKEE